MQGENVMSVDSLIRDIEGRGWFDRLLSAAVLFAMSSGLLLLGMSVMSLYHWALILFGVVVLEPVGLFGCIATVVLLFPRSPASRLLRWLWPRFSFGMWSILSLFATFVVAMLIGFAVSPLFR
jgi:hypothetical protein